MSVSLPEGPTRPSPGSRERERHARVCRVMGTLVPKATCAGQRQALVPRKAAADIRWAPGAGLRRTPPPVLDRERPASPSRRVCRISVDTPVR